MRIVQETIAHASFVSSAWYFSGIRVLYAQPFLYSRFTMHEFTEAVSQNSQLACLVRCPTVVCDSVCNFPYLRSKERRPTRWWQTQLSGPKIEMIMDSFASALVCCPNQQGLTYYIHQKEGGFNLPKQLFNDHCIGRSLTIAASLRYALGFPTLYTLSDVEELRIAGVSLATTLPELPKLRVLIIAKCRLDPVYFQGPLFFNDRQPESLRRIDLLANNNTLVALAVTNLIVGFSTIEWVTLVGEHEVTALDRLFGTARLMSSVKELILDSRGVSPLHAARNHLSSLQSLVIVLLGCAQETTNELLALASVIENNRCPSLTRLDVQGYSVALHAEEADTITFNRLEAWCVSNYCATNVLTTCTCS